MTMLVPNTSQRIDPQTVIGWGVDADPRNDPTYPFRDRSKDDDAGLNWERPSTQHASVEVLQSVEHNRRPAVVGTSTPPRGISGVLRRSAFGYSESDWRHWLMLLGADRINVVEGVLQDVAGGRLPNIPAEMGAGAEWRHNRAGFIGKAAALTALTFVTVALLRRRRR